VPLVARIKILAGMRIDDRRSPQDGCFTADLGGFSLDLRVSSLPTHWGEKIVLRVLGSMISTTSACARPTATRSSPHSRSRSAWCW
jgi:type II secretory ATPase GspE/PulE/Tfp pilus assembly ATPase PilB-like protein